MIVLCAWYTHILENNDSNACKFELQGWIVLSLI